ncbi:MAG TPA: CBASS oligonucleotide cyclase [Frankiaceae bacterium]|nr:CBASS oligonucleotide cyclase [Frankiaceae bacterium]
MRTVAEAFTEFSSRLEITETESDSASRRQRNLRKQVKDGGVDVVDDFLIGAYARHTKTKPLRDVDILVVLDDRAYLDKRPRKVLDAVKAILDPLYGADRVCIDRFAVRVDFGVSVVNDVSSEVISFDVVPAFTEGDHYLIPDDHSGEWIKTDPTVHADKATAANKALDEHWKPLVKMIKKWNDHAGGPVEPSFLIEVMALDLLCPPWTGQTPYLLREFFASAAERIDDGWPDPAELGPYVSDILDGAPAKMTTAKAALRAAEASCTEAMRLDRAKRTSDALAAWRALFGPLFPSS